MAEKDSTLSLETLVISDDREPTKADGELHEQGWADNLPPISTLSGKINCTAENKKPSFRYLLLFTTIPVVKI